MTEMSLPVFAKAEKKTLNGLGGVCFSFSGGVASEFFTAMSSSPEAERAFSLKGMSAASEKGQLLLVFEAGAELVHVEVDCASLREIPSLREVWPVASWWEDELEREGNFRFSASKRIEGVRWRQ